MNLSYSNKLNLQKQNNIPFICLVVMVKTTVLLVKTTVLLVNFAKEEVMWAEKAHHDCKVKMDQI